MFNSANVNSNNGEGNGHARLSAQDTSAECVASELHIVTWLHLIKVPPNAIACSPVPRSKAAKLIARAGLVAFGAPSLPELRTYRAESHSSPLMEASNVTTREDPEVEYTL